MNPMGDAGYFLIHTAFYLYITVVMVRFLLQLVRADFYNPISQFTVKATAPLINPLRRYIPGYGGVDVAAIVLMLALKLVELYLLSAFGGVSPGPVQMVFLALAGLLELAINLYIFMIIVQVVMSWVNPGVYNDVTAIIYRLTEPLMAPVRRLLPPMGGLDLSPLFVLIGLQLVKILVVGPLQGLGVAGVM